MRPKHAKDDQNFIKAGEIFDHPADKHSPKGGHRIEEGVY